MASRPLVALVVDDDPVFLRLARRALTATGVEVLEAATGAGALQLAATVPVDLLLLDYNLPDTDGVRLLSQLRDQGIEGPALLWTGNAHAALVQAALAAGAVECLAKDSITEAALARAVAHLLGVDAQPRPARP